MSNGPATNHAVNAAAVLAEGLQQVRPGTRITNGTPELGGRGFTCKIDGTEWTVIMFKTVPAISRRHFHAGRTEVCYCPDRTYYQGPGPVGGRA